MKTIDWFRTIAAILNDDEPGRPFQRYPLKDMIAAYNHAICIVVKYRLDQFTEYRQVKLVPGKYQDIRKCCSNALDVLEQVDGHGNIIKAITGARNTTATVKRSWSKPSCLAAVGADGYVVDSVNIDSNMAGRFTVTPPVPCDVDAWVKVKCVSTPCPLTEADAEGEMDNACLHNTAAWHYVLATMLTGDRDAHMAANLSQYHYRMFFNLLDIDFRMEEIFESGSKA